MPLAVVLLARAQAVMIFKSFSFPSAQCRHSVKVLHVLRRVVGSNHTTPNTFFQLPAVNSVGPYWDIACTRLARSLCFFSIMRMADPQGIIVPPIKSVPPQGYTFSTWVRFEAASLHTQADAPTLFRYPAAQSKRYPHALSHHDCLCSVS